MREILKDKISNRTYYCQYGKVFRFSMRSINRLALAIDTLIPLTFFIPVILTNIISFIIGKDKEFMIVRSE